MICQKCGIDKDESQFGKSYKKNRKLFAWCKECRKEYDRERYQANRNKIVRQKADRRREIRNWVIEYKRNCKCEICGETHIACLEFHHIDDNKDFNLSEARGRSIRTIKEEILKCRILCANCHRKEHFKEK